MDINTKSLREQVYEYLREKINNGEIKKGDFLDLNALSNNLRISKTPLRDALIKLESDGFVEIQPRRGIKVKSISMDDIKNLYQIIGALECSIIIENASKLKEKDMDRMENLNKKMKEALDNNDFNRYYSLNLKFHDIYLNLSTNTEALRIISISKQRLYDFPRRKEYVPDWEYNSLKEHSKLIKFLRDGHSVKAGMFIKDVHWSFKVQKKFIEKYYKEY